MGPCAETALFQDTTVRAEDGGLPKDSSKEIDTCRRSQQLGCKGEKTIVAFLDLIPSRKAECMSKSMRRAGVSQGNGSCHELGKGEGELFRDPA